MTSSLSNNKNHQPPPPGPPQDQDETDEQDLLPLPLNLTPSLQEDFQDLNDDDVRQLAATLAPHEQELESLLQDVSHLTTGTTDGDDTVEYLSDDDELSQEFQNLSLAHESLQHELDLAQRFGTPQKEIVQVQVPVPLPPQVTDDTSNHNSKAYTLQQHAQYLQLGTEAIGGWYYVGSSSGNNHILKDYCLPLPVRKLRRLFSGIITNSSTNTSTNNSKEQDEPLPIRTVSIAIRPDVLCGSVLDAVAQTLLNTTSSSSNNKSSAIWKRQGGHLRGIMKTKDNTQVVVDAQLTTTKHELERRLLLRLYHPQDCQTESTEMTEEIKSNDHKSSILSNTNQELSVDDDNPFSHSNSMSSSSPSRLRQACSLIQRLMMSNKQPNDTDNPDNNNDDWMQDFLKSQDSHQSSFHSKASLQIALNDYLLHHFSPCPSVRAENQTQTLIRRLTLPALNTELDYPLIQSSWKLVELLVQELSSRDLCPDSYSHLNFGQFPCLPTLDVHYCSQLRRLSRESMIASLLKSAKELEDYCKSVEYACANLVVLLTPTLQLYGIPAPPLPQAKPLEDYPLDYTAPQLACPPWGQLVLEALQQVTAATTTTTTDSTSSMTADQAVQLVYAAFTTQDDAEQAARLDRKNAQVMDRLQHIHQHEVKVLELLQESSNHNPQAQRATDQFVTKALQAHNVGRDGYPDSDTLSTLNDQVPLLQCRISTNASTSGTLTITRHCLLIHTTTLLGRTSTILLLELASLTFQVLDHVTSTLLNPFPNTLDILVGKTNSKPKQSILQLRPAIGPHRLVHLLTTLQELEQEQNSQRDGGTAGFASSTSPEDLPPNDNVDADIEGPEMSI